GAHHRGEPDLSSGRVVVFAVPRACDLPCGVGVQPIRRRAAGHRGSAPAAIAVRATMNNTPKDALLAIRDLRVSIATDEGLARVLDHVDLTIPKGRIVGVVGESGCGKSTLIRTILGILPEGAQVDKGLIRFYGTDLLSLGQRELSRRIRGKEIGFIPQDPYLAFNPVFSVGRQLLEIMRWHGEASGDRDAKPTRSDRRRHREQLIELLRIVQIPDPENALERYPHQFSGGQRQRLLIAGA